MERKRFTQLIGLDQIPREELIRALSSLASDWVRFFGPPQLIEISNSELTDQQKELAQRLRKHKEVNSAGPSTLDVESIIDPSRDEVRKVLLEDIQHMSLESLAQVDKSRYYRSDFTSCPDRWTGKCIGELIGYRTSLARAGFRSPFCAA